jgi:hypothetical protein
MSQLNKQIVTDGYMGSALTSYPINIRSFPHFSIHWWVSAGTPSGTLKLQASSEDEDRITQLSGTALCDTYVTHWVDLSSIMTDQTVTSGSPATGIFNTATAGYKWVRLVWTPSGGTGTLQARIQAKNSCP